MRAKTLSCSTSFFAAVATRVGSNCESATTVRTWRPGMPPAALTIPNAPRMASTSFSPRKPAAPDSGATTPMVMSLSVTPCEWAPLTETGSGGMGNAPPGEPAAGPPAADGVAPAAGLAADAAPVFAAGPLEAAGVVLPLAPAAAGAAPPPAAAWPAACPGWAAEAAPPDAAGAAEDEPAASVVAAPGPAAAAAPAAAAPPGRAASGPPGT